MKKNLGAKPYLFPQPVMIIEVMMNMEKRMR